MEWTGERYLPTLPDPEISYEHWHRYLHASAFVAGKDVLDVASGEGFGSNLLARSARRVVGVDRCAEAIRHATSKYTAPNLEFRAGDAAALPLAGAHVFDVVVSFETIEHLDEECQARFLGEVKRLLRHTGVFLVSTPNKLLYTDRPSYQNAFHLREFYLSDFKDLLGRYFRHAEYLGQKVYPISYLWPLDRRAGRSREYQLGFADGCYGPPGRDAREEVYVLAVCSDSPVEPAGGSLLLDVTGQAIHQRVMQVAEQEGQIQGLAAELARSREQLLQQEGQLQVLSAALSGAQEQLAQQKCQTQALMTALNQAHDQLVDSPDLQVAPGQNAATVSLVRAAAARHGVTPAIHAKDFIFKFVLTQGSMVLPDAVNYYFDDGARSAQRLAELVATALPSRSRPVKLLEFASGYGCVTRHLCKSAEFELVSCDSHPPAIGFLTNRLGVTAIPSTLSPDEFVLPERYDVVFALSFFSHMPKVSFGRWLKSLYGAVKVSGCLIFTTHGMASRRYMGNPQIPSDGYWFSASSEQEDLHGAGYGLSITTPEFVRGEIERQLGAARIESRLAHWWEHQDLWVVHRETN